MSSTSESESPQVHKSTSISRCIFDLLSSFHPAVVALTTIAVTLICLHKFCPNVLRGNVILKPRWHPATQLVDQGAKDERNPNISTPNSKPRGDGNAPSTEIASDGNPRLPIAMDASLIATVLESFDSGDRVATGEAPPVPFIQGGSDTGNEMFDAQGPCVHTDGGTYIGTADISGCGNAFGNNNIVNNTQTSNVNVQGSSSFKINKSDIIQIHGSATIIQPGDDQFNKDQMNLICDYMANLAVLPSISHHVNRNFLTQLIINLPRAEAVFNDYQTKKKTGLCFKGTRVALLREMAGWVTCLGESRIYVLSGLAGIGKSTVAYTIASRAANINLLGASFFFSRDEADRQNAKKFFTTIAYQLCVYSEAFAKAIGDVLVTERGSAATTKDPQEQCQALIVDPLRNIIQSRARPILVVVDALDECDEEDIDYVLTGLFQLVQNLPSFKVIVTARPQPLLERFFGPQKAHKIFYLQDIEDKVIDNDIRLYLRHCLSPDQVREQLQDPEEVWCASDTQIESLVLLAGKLFVIASTAVRFILDKVASDPQAQMQQLLPGSTQNHIPFKDLAHFYTIILRNVVPADCDDPSLVGRYRAIVGAIILVQTPLPVAILALLINVGGVKQIRTVARKLQSVILLGNDDIPRIYHKSFSDFITDSKRCHDVNLHIDSGIRHTEIAICCFQIMEQNLKYNILGLRNPTQFMSNEDSLARNGITDEQLKAKISQPLQYACVYWANHFRAANIENVVLIKELEKFARQRILYWFEALSLIGKLDSAHLAIRVVLKALKPSFPGLYKLLYDGLRFVSKFYETIKRSALHTYYSALPFTPKDSPLRRLYIKEVPHNFCGVDGVPERWDALVANMIHGDEVDDIQFSIDDTMFASQSTNRDRSRGVWRLWDAATGTPISTIRGTGFAIANDFSTVASFMGKSLTLHDKNGSVRGTVLATQAKICKVAISLESCRIAAGLCDGTLCLWNSGNGELIGNFGNKVERNYRDHDWHHFQFSACGTRLAYVLTNRAPELRDGSDGRRIANLDPGSDRVAFSRDGSRIVSLQPGYGLKLWTCKFGKRVSVVKDASIGLWLAISANGVILATEDNGRVKLWHERRGVLSCFKVLNIDLEPYSMTFSLNDILAIATLFDIQLYNARTDSFISTFSFAGSKGAPVTFSSDCSRLAAGNTDGTVYLWEIPGIEVSSLPSNQQARSRVTALALSLDCSRVACGFSDGAIELWDTRTITKQRIGVHKEGVRTLGFSPDGRRFASGSYDGIINLWDGEDGALVHGGLQYESWLCAVVVSDNVLAAAGDGGIVLWDAKTLYHIDTFEGSFTMPFSFSTNGALLVAAVSDIAPNATASHDTSSFYTASDHNTSESSADIASFHTASDPAALEDGASNDAASFYTASDHTSEHTASFHTAADHNASCQIILFNVTMRTSVAMFDVPSRRIIATAFNPDNSQLVVQFFDDKFLTFNLANKEVIQGPTFAQFIQLPHMPRWQGIPVWLNMEGKQLRALFSQYDDPVVVPVLWIPRELHVLEHAQGCSIIALGCEDGRVVLLRPCNSPCG